MENKTPSKLIGQVTGSEVTPFAYGSIEKAYAKN